MRVVVVHRDAGEALELAARLRREGFDAEPYPGTGTKGFRGLRANPPDAILIDLMRLPSYGRAIGALLREGKATRSIPLVFLEGDPEKTKLAKALLPDAGFATLPKLAAALRRAVERPPSTPVVPDLSGIPLAKKLRIQAGAKVGVVGAPEGFEIAGLPEGAVIRRGRRDGDVVLIFVSTLAVLAKEARGLADMPPGRALWLAWPKRTSRAAGAVSIARINEACAAVGLVAYQTCAVDGTWSAVAVSRKKGSAPLRATGRDRKGAEDRLLD